MHTAIYVRVSTARQDEASQLPELERWAAAHCDPKSVVWYRDTFTGKTMDRPGWSTLETQIHWGQVDRVIVWRLDRLGRTAKGLVALFDDLYTRGVNLVSIREMVDLKTAAGRLMANVMASVAAYETEVRAERVRAGQDAARAKGKHLGRPRGTGKPTKVTPDHRAEIARMKAEGKAVAAIARVCGLSRETVYSVLKGSGKGPG